MLGKNKRKILLWIAPILSISMLFIFRLTTEIFGITIGYVIGFCVYWFIFCIPMSFITIDSRKELKRIYLGPSSNFFSKKCKYHISAFIPCIATFCVIFYNLYHKVGFEVLAIALIFALVNGTIEELFWRGNYIKTFDNNLSLAYIYPSVFFGIWHIGLFFAKGITYHGGLPALVGGAFFMGLLWGLVAYRTKSIATVTLAHIITNFFAFTGLIYDNWYC